MIAEAETQFPFSPERVDCDRFYFDEAAAKKAVVFILKLRHAKGAVAGRAFKLEPWQRRIVEDLFGWKRRADDSRRYRIAYVEVPRKNGKSTLAAAIALYLLFEDDEPGAEVYSIAGDIQQASLVFDPACLMIRNREEYAVQAKFLSSKKRIELPLDGSFYRAVAASKEASHGYNPSGILFDEIHNQSDRDLWDIMQTGTGARRQPLTLGISTAGHNRSSICWELHQYSERILAGDVVDDYFYAVLYGADDDDDWTDPAVWAKANPNLGVSVSFEYLEEQCERAKRSAGLENSFRMLHLNQWVQQSIRWLKVREWNAGAREQRPEDLETYPRYCGLDLASTRDVNSLVSLWELDGGHFWVEPRFWIPAEPFDERGKNDRTQLQNWATQGFIETTPGNVTDYATIRRRTLEENERQTIQEMAYDPWGPAVSFVQDLAADGFEADRLTQFRQTVGNFAAPSKKLEELIVSGKIHHDGNPVMSWMIGNVAAKVDVSGNIRPDKEKSADKIDGVVSLIMALGCAMLAERVEQEVGFRTL